MGDRRDDPGPVHEPIGGANAGADPSAMAGSERGPTRPAKSPWLGIAIDYGPLLVFFLAYRLAARGGTAEIAALVQSTGAFIVAAIAALAISRWKLGRISPMLLLSTVLIVGFGALTIWFGDPFFVQVKPTIIYGFFAVLLLGGWLRNRALLKVLLETAFEGVNDAGWLKLSRNWGAFFVVLALLNEGLRQSLSFEAWLAAKLWVFLPLSFLFTAAQLPMLLRHGLKLGEEDAAIAAQPPTGD